MFEKTFWIFLKSAYGLETPQ